MRLITPPAEPVVTVAEAKAHTRIPHDEEDALVETYINAATQHFDGFSGVLGRCLVTQTWRLTYSAWDVSFGLVFPDVESAVLTYTDENEATQTVAAGDYFIRPGHPDRLAFVSGYSWPSLYAGGADAIQIDVTAGYGAAANVPAGIKAAILLMVGHLYANREAVSVDQHHVVPMAVDALVSPYRRIAV